MEAEAQGAAAVVKLNHVKKEFAAEKRKVESLRECQKEATAAAAEREKALANELRTIKSELERCVEALAVLESYCSSNLRLTSPQLICTTCRTCSTAVYHRDRSPPSRATKRSRQDHPTGSSPRSTQASLCSSCSVSLSANRFVSRLAPYCVPVRSCEEADSFARPAQRQPSGPRA